MHPFESRTVKMRLEQKESVLKTVFRAKDKQKKFQKKCVAKVRILTTPLNLSEKRFPFINNRDF